MPTSSQAGDQLCSSQTNGPTPAPSPVLCIQHVLYKYTLKSVPVAVQVLQKVIAEVELGFTVGQACDR